MTTSLGSDVKTSDAKPKDTQTAVVETSDSGVRGTVHAKPASNGWEDDAANPANWSTGRKYRVTILLSAFTFNTLMSSTIVAPALPKIQQNLNISSEARTQLVFSIYVLSYCVGYFFWAPISELYGKRPVIQIANAWFCIWNLLCGFAPNTATIMVGRLFSGAGAAANLALGIGAVAEIWRPDQRGKSLAALSVLTLLGPSLGPIIGGSVAEYSASSWRWAFWATTISNIVLQLLAIRYLRESHGPTILKQKRKLNIRAGVIAETDKNLDMETNYTITWRLLQTAFKRPLYLFLSQPACAGIVLYAGVNFGSIYVIIGATSMAFTQVYHQSTIIASLNYLSYGVGTILAAQINGRIIDWLFERDEQKHKNCNADTEKSIATGQKFVPLPEIRLHPLLAMTLLVGAGFLLMGWTLHYRAHWIFPNIGIVLVGFGSQGMTQCTNAYVIDCYSSIKRVCHRKSSDTQNLATAQVSTEATAVKLNWTASAMAAIWIFKSLGGFAFPLFGVDMIVSLGWGWGLTLLAMLNVVVGVPVSVTLLIYGPRLREIGQRKIEQKMLTGAM